MLLITLGIIAAVAVVAAVVVLFGFRRAATRDEHEGHARDEEGELLHLAPV